MVIKHQMVYPENIQTNDIIETKQSVFIYFGIFMHIYIYNFKRRHDLERYQEGVYKRVWREEK